MPQVEYKLGAGIYSEYKEKLKRKIKDSHPIYKMIARTENSMECIWKSGDGKSMVHGKFEGHGAPATITLMNCSDEFIEGMDSAMMEIMDEANNKNAVHRTEITKAEAKKRGSGDFDRRLEIEYLFRLRDMKSVEEEMKLKGAPKLFIKKEYEKEEKLKKDIAEELKIELGMI